MYYTGLGVARSLGEHGIPVIGLSAQRWIYGNLSRYAKVQIAPDSRKQPEELFRFLSELGQSKTGQKAVVFPTRDDDIVFLDCYREELEQYFVLAIPSPPAVRACLDKWETHHLADAAGISIPKTWVVNRLEDLPAVLEQVTYPCVLKPIFSYDWRRGQNWALVGGRKAIGVASREEFLQEFHLVSAAEKRVLVQELVQGDDNQLFVGGCFCNGQSEITTWFTARKLVQIPEGFGTGCIVQAAECPEILPLAQRLLCAMRFTGIAELEFKRDGSDGSYKLIEINARPWDQHRLGHSCGADVIYAAYRYYAGLTPASSEARGSVAVGPDRQRKWIAEDVFAMALLRRLWKKDTSVRRLLCARRGKRIFAIWSAADPLPSAVWAISFSALLAVNAGVHLWSWFGHIWNSLFRSKRPLLLEAKHYELQNTKSQL
jgi:predicted ATP-grasp superfamily ATP-dependent carboligase